MNSKDFLSDIVQHLTGVATRVDVHEDEYGAILTVYPQGNVSALIGHGGATIDAVRTLCKAIGYNGKYRIKLKVDEQNRR